MAKKNGGLEGVIALSSTICQVEGDRGKLAFRGIDIHELVANSTFEETAYLLWYGELPTRVQLRGLEEKLFSSRDLPRDVTQLITRITRSWDPMETLRTAVSSLSAYDPGGTDHRREEDLQGAIMLTARMPVIVAAHHRVRRKLAPIAPRHDLPTAANLLYMLTGRVPEERAARILDACLVIHAEHELNASTFAARVAASTLADIYSAVTSAIGTLDGPLHGGANERVMEMLEGIGEPEKAEDYVLNLLSQHKRIPGFGHRVYKTADPRATELRPMAAELAGQTPGGARLYEMWRRIEEVTMREKGLNANLDFVSALVYHFLDIPTDLMTPLFACSRIVGWTSHILEQYADNRLIRPLAEYLGPKDVPYLPIDQREVARAA